MSLESLRVSAYFNGGDSFQFAVIPMGNKPDDDDGYIVSHTQASHGYASLPEVSVATKLADVVEEIKTAIENTRGYREDPEIQIEGTDAFAAEVKALSEA